MERSVLAGVVAVGLAMGGLAPAVATAQTFEGVVHYTIRDDEGKTTEIVQASRHGKLRIGTIENGRESGMIMDSIAGTVTFVDGRKQTYTTISRQMMEQMRGMTRGMARGMRRQADRSNDDERPAGKVTRTGRSETVAGVRCDVWTYDGMEDGKHVTGEACLAKGVGMLSNGGLGFGLMGEEGRQAMQERYRDWGEIGNLMAQGYGILKASSMRDGKPAGSIEVTAIERGAPSDAQFQPPAGYKQQSMMGRP